jgi:ABC-2 type transport system permease protein
MTGLAASIKAEFLKISRSMVLPVTFMVSALVPVMMSFMMFVLKNPELSHKLGLVGTKAKLLGVADWPSYLTFLAQGVCAIEIVIFGFICAWVFGREYMDRTIKDLLALPMKRYVTVISKFIAVSVWCVVLYLFIFFLSLAGGFVVSLPLWNIGAGKDIFCALLISTLTVIYLNTVVAFIACSTRSYLTAVGFVILSAVFINFTGIIGFGEYYPWAVPILYAVKAGGVQPGLISWVIVFITGAAGFACTVAWWRYADQN